MGRFFDLKNPPWKQLNRRLNNADQLLDGWETLESRCREIIGWRMQLVPYLTAAFQRYAIDGTPPFRALVMDTPKDKRLLGVDDQYMIGGRMMVAPLFAAEPWRKVVIPEGNWHDFWTGELIEGVGDFVVTGSTDKFPVFVKSGSIVPWADVGLFAGAPESRRLTARVYGDGSLPFKLTDDEGTLLLNWSNGQGNASGTSRYEVYSWKQIG